MAKLSNREMSLTASGLVVGLIAGGSIGYFATKKQLELKYEKFAQTEVEEMREHYRQKVMALEPKESLDVIVKDLGYVPEVPEIPSTDEVIDQLLSQPVESVAVPQNVFEEAKQLEAEAQTWDWDAERASRDPDRPYIIHLDEFMQPGNENSHITYTYYSVDQVLIDENDDPIVGNQVVDNIVGLENLKMLGTGKGTDDPNTILVRNEKLHMDIEIANHPFSYEQEHMGELEHADDYRRRHRRPRFDDE